MILSDSSPTDEDMEDERFLFLLDLWKYIKKVLIYMDIFIPDLY